MTTRKTKKAAAASRKRTKTSAKQRRWKINGNHMSEYIDLKAEAEAEVARLREQYQGKLDRLMGDMRITADVPDDVQVGIRGSYWVEVKGE